MAVIVYYFLVSIIRIVNDQNIMSSEMRDFQNVEAFTPVLADTNNN